MKALLDELLSKKLASGKLFLGQKLRVDYLSLEFIICSCYSKCQSIFPAAYSLYCHLKIWGAKLCGWIGPVSPFEVNT